MHTHEIYKYYRKKKQQKIYKNKLYYLWWNTSLNKWDAHSISTSTTFKLNRISLCYAYLKNFANSF